MSLGGMMKQVQEMQAKMAEMQQRLADTEVTGQAGSGAVVATMNGKGELRKIKIDPKLAAAADVEMLEDLIVASCHAAKQQAEAHVAAETEKIMGGLPLPPGMKLPF